MITEATSLNGPLQYAKRIAYSSEETLMFTHAMAVKFKDSPGVYVECGVAAGAQIIAMACGAPNKTIYAFDSFKGIPLPSNMDDQYPGISMLTETEQKALPNPDQQELISTGATVVSHQDFVNHIINSGVSRENIIVREGWFQDTVWLFPYEIQISILRLDGDLYQSTFVCLNNLFKSVVKGGLVIIDDWGLSGCRKACEDFFYIYRYKPDYKFISDIAYFFK